MLKIMTKYCGFVALFCAVAIIFMTGSVAAREITDMAGRKVVLPNSLKKVYAPSPYGSYIMYSIDPSMLSGLIFPLKDEDKQFLQSSIWNLPVIGSLFGQGQTANIEILLKAKPDVIVMWSAKKSALNEKAEETLKKLNIPFVYSVTESMADYPAAYVFLGKLLGREERTEKLATYCRKALTDARTVVERVPADQRPKVYYAEGVDGLSTECNDSIHVELLSIAGDRNVHRCHTSSHKGFEKVSLEQVMVYQPDVIIAQEKVFYDKVFKDPAWQQVKAVRLGRVHLVPHSPFNWFDRPPSFMRFLGLKWLTNCLYPQDYRIDIVKESRAFYQLFLGAEISEQQMKKIIYPYLNH
jgi:iron complex transport system substrate-binding protein